MTDDGIDLPEDVWLPFESPNSHLQLMFPIALGGVWEYPMAEVRPTIEECVRRIGADHLIWGSAMPIVLRYVFKNAVRSCGIRELRRFVMIVGVIIDG